MHLHQHRQTGFHRQRMKFSQLFVRQNGDNEQNRVGAPLNGFKDLPFINDEILAQQWQLHRRSNLPEMIQ